MKEIFAYDFSTFTQFQRLSNNIIEKILEKWFMGHVRQTEGPFCRSIIRNGFRIFHWSIYQGLWSCFQSLLFGHGNSPFYTKTNWKNLIKWTFFITVCVHFDYFELRIVTNDKPLIFVLFLIFRWCYLAWQWKWQTRIEVKKNKRIKIEIQ